MRMTTVDSEAEATGREGGWERAASKEKRSCRIVLRLEREGRMIGDLEGKDGAPSKEIGKLFCDRGDRSIGDIEGREKGFDEGNWEIVLRLE